jgi:DNA-binding NtrC family response regulator
MTAEILVIEDDQNAGKAMISLLEREGHQVTLKQDGQSGLQAALDTPYDLVITDIVMPKMDGMSLFRELKQKKPDASIMIMTAHGNIEMAVEAMREGAIDFLEKPLNIDHVRMVVKKALSLKKLQTENRQLKRRIGEVYSLKNLVGQSAGMKELSEKILQVAATDASVLILGESGTGKELVANALHENSSRNGKPFVKINCAALPDELLQSELFGHVKGAFTGAQSTRKGRFEEADGGTLFLDEIGDLPLNMQIKLLRVLQEGTFERVGDNKTLTIDVRLITATHVNLEEALKAGKLREDFYYRIKGITLNIPALRERKEDIPLLIQHFFAKADRGDCLVESDALEVLKNFSWPGNVRQLQHVLESLLAFANDKKIKKAELPAEILNPQSKKTAGTETPVTLELSTLAAMEQKMIEKAMLVTDGNKTKAAALLGIGLRTLYRKLDS